MSLSLISTALAANATPAAGAGAENFNMIFLLVAFVAIFYFMILRPQNKRNKEHRDMLSKLSTDDEVITSGGLLGRVIKIKDNFVEIAIADEVRVIIQKPAIAALVPKGTMKSFD